MIIELSICRGDKKVPRSHWCSLVVGYLLKMHRGPMGVALNNEVGAVVEDECVLMCLSELIRVRQRRTG